MQGGVRIAPLQSLYEVAQCHTLGCRARIFRLPPAVESADIADADAPGILPQAVGTYLLLPTATNHRAVKIYQVMITDGAEASLFVPGGDIRHCHLSTLRSRCAV